MNMKTLVLFGAIPFLVAGSVIAASDKEAPGGELKPVSAFDGIDDKAKRSVALFAEAGKVMLTVAISPHLTGLRPSHKRTHLP